MAHDARVRETEMLALAIYFAHQFAYESGSIESVADVIIALLPVPVDALQRTCAIARAKQRVGET